MSKEKNIDVLQHKIAELDVRIANLEKQDISHKKIDNLKMLKLQYEDELSELEYA